MTPKEMKLNILNQVLKDLPKSDDEADMRGVSVYVCDNINNMSCKFRGEAYDIADILTSYIHERIGKVFSVFEFLNLNSYDPDDFTKAYEYRIDMLNDMIRLVESDQL